ncbi:MAG TPA: acetyl-CoA carboxylase biotin carboxyl carrier protein [Methylovirgula sp.]|jgi:acetyl-CoA carboxylase biotin carboxyl carrier protein
MAKEKSEMEAATGIDPKLVEILGEIATRLELSEVEVAHGDLKIRVARQLSVAPAPVVAVAAAPLAAAAPRAAAAPAAIETHPGMITSPMVGTAYLRASPDAARFVEPGASVKAGETLLLIEAMKTFNEIVAPRAGTVAAILVEDTQPVEFGQPLIVIE